MPTSDTSEKGLESLIFNSLIGYGGGPASGVEGVRETGSVRYVAGDSKDYDRDHAVDIDKLLAFLETTQPKVFAQLGIAADGPARLKFLARLQGEIAKRGVVDVLRKGIQHGAASVDLFYGAPSPGNPKAAQRFEANLFSVTRQLRYSKDESQLSIDFAIFIIGLPIIPLNLRTASPNRPCRMLWSSTCATAIHASCYSSSAAASCTLQWTTRKCASAPTSRAMIHGSCHLTRVSTTEQATRQILTVSSLIICGAPSSSEGSLQTSSRTTRRS